MIIFLNEEAYINTNAISAISQVFKNGNNKYCFKVAMIDEDVHLSTQYDTELDAKTFLKTFIRKINNNEN